MIIYNTCRVFVKLIIKSMVNNILKFKMNKSESLL